MRPRWPPSWTGRRLRRSRSRQRCAASPTRWWSTKYPERDILRLTIRNADAPPARIACVEVQDHILTGSRRSGGRMMTRSRQEKMLDGLRQFITDVMSPTAHEHRTFDDAGYRLAATALLVHVISLDGEPAQAEKRKLHSLIESRFGLDP